MRRAARDGLTALRFISLAFCAALLALLLVLVLTLQGTDPKPVPSFAPFAVLVAGALGLIGVLFLRSRPLDGASSFALAVSYRTTFFLGMACSEAPALLGFVMAMIYRRLWLYAIGMAVGFVGFALMAPTRSELDRRQGALSAGGSALDLRAALTSPNPAPSDGPT
jgi:hypothetical protein